MIQRRDDKLLEQIADRFRALRKERLLTQDAVYEDTGVDIGRIEKSRINPSISTINSLCEYYEISLEEFFRDIK